jgi:hypothetical protein
MKLSASYSTRISTLYMLLKDDIVTCHQDSARSSGECFLPGLSIVKAKSTIKELLDLQYEEGGV